MLRPSTTPLSMEVSGWLVRVLELQRSFVGAISLRKAASRIGLKARQSSGTGSVFRLEIGFVYSCR